MYFAFDSLRFADEPDPPVSSDSGGKVTGLGATCLPSPWEATDPADPRSGVSAGLEFDNTGLEAVSPVNRCTKMPAIKSTHISNSNAQIAMTS